MKRKVLVLVVVLILLGLLVQSVSFADPINYSDVVHQLVVSWNQNVSRDELTKLYGEPLYETETYLSFWDAEKSTQYTFFFSDQRLTHIDVTCGPFSKENWSYSYNQYTDTLDKLGETLGERQGVMLFYNGDERTASDVDCYISSWSGNGIDVLVTYNQTDTQVSVFTKIMAAR